MSLQHLNDFRLNPPCQDAQHSLVPIPSATRPAGIDQFRIPTLDAHPAGTNPDVALIRQIAETSGWHGGGIRKRAVPQFRGGLIPGHKNGMIVNQPALWVGGSIQKVI